MLTVSGAARGGGPLTRPSLASQVRERAAPHGLPRSKDENRVKSAPADLRARLVVVEEALEDGEPSTAHAVLLDLRDELLEAADEAPA